MELSLSYIVAATPRCGSTLLCEGLALAGAGRPDEHFLVWHADGSATPDRTLEQALTDGTANGIFGVKLMGEHLDEVASRLRRVNGVIGGRPLEALSAVLPNLRFVHASRRDKVRQAISWALAIRTNRWVELSKPSPDTGATSTPVVTYDGDLVEWCFRTVVDHEHKWNEAFRASGVVPHRVSYEHMVDAFADTVQGVLTFLGVGSADQSVFSNLQMQRQSNATNEEWVRRFCSAHPDLENV